MTRSVLSPRSLRPALGGGLALALMAAPLMAQTTPPAPPMPVSYTNIRAHETHAEIALCGVWL